MKYLITGGAGFIGSTLAERLIENGHRVCVIDNLSTGKYENIEPLIKNDNFRFVIGSILDGGDIVDKLVCDCDVIFHMAAVVGVELILQDPIKVFETNIIGTENILRSAAQYKKKIILASSSEVYGKSTNYPFKEDGDLCLGPATKSRWLYAGSKALDEQLAFAYYRQQDLPIVIVRFFNVIGPRQLGNYGMVVPKFVNAAVKNQPLKVFGDGSQTRCFIDVCDVSDALYQLSLTSSALGEIFNLGSDEEISIIDLAKLVKRLSNSTSAIDVISYDNLDLNGFEDMHRRVPDISKLSRVLSFKTKFSLEMSIQKIIDYVNMHGESKVV
jgi:UDP-glucose 4-epimerase